MQVFIVNNLYFNVLIIDRILQIIQFKGINKNKFYKLVGLSNGFLDKATRDIGSSKIEQILRVYPEISPEWLLMGKGNMLREDTTKGVQDPEGGYSKQSLERMLEHLNENREIYQKFIASYENRLEKMEKEIASLKEELKK